MVAVAQLVELSPRDREVVTFEPRARHTAASNLRRENR